MSRYPARNPRLPELPGVVLCFNPDRVAAWTARRLDGSLVAQSPWKKLTWKLAKAALEGRDYYAS